MHLSGTVYFRVPVSKIFVRGKKKSTILASAARSNLFLDRGSGSRAVPTKKVAGTAHEEKTGFPLDGQSERSGRFGGSDAGGSLSVGSGSDSTFSFRCRDAGRAMRNDTTDPEKDEVSVDVNVCPYPSAISARFEKMRTVKLPTKIWGDLVSSRSNLMLAVERLENDKLYFHLKTLDARGIEFFETLLKETIAGDRDVGNKFLPWMNVFRRLSLPFSPFFPDIRSYFFWDNSYYLVNRHFTFGQMTVPEGKCHVFQTNRRPLLLYRLSDGKAVKMAERSFEPLDQKFYSSYYLEDGIYKVPEGTTYVVISTQRTLFAASVHAEDVELPDGWKMFDANPAKFGVPSSTPAAAAEKRVSDLRCGIISVFSRRVKSTHATAFLKRRAVLERVHFRYVF